MYNGISLHMKKFLLLIMFFFAGMLTFHIAITYINTNIVTGAPPYDTSKTDNVTDGDVRDLIRNWTRPEVPAKVGLQVGHWQNENLPEELEKLKGNTGASGGGKTEWEVNYEIAIRTKALLEEQGITVELIPATVPKQYWADVFVSIHADGNLDPTKSGYKASGPWRDVTGSSDELLSAVETSYAKATGLPYDENITRNMRGYYGFSWWRYAHAVHPMTTSIILETGFLSSPSDQELLIGNPQASADGLAEGIIAYLHNKELL